MGPVKNSIRPPFVLFTWRKWWVLWRTVSGLPLYCSHGGNHGSCEEQYQASLCTVHMAEIMGSLKDSIRPPFVLFTWWKSWVLWRTVSGLPLYCLHGGNHGFFDGQYQASLCTVYMVEIMGSLKDSIRPPFVLFTWGKSWVLWRTVSDHPLYCLCGWTRGFFEEQKQTWFGKLYPVFAEQNVFWLKQEVKNTGRLLNNSNNTVLNCTENSLFVSSVSHWTASKIRVLFMGGGGGGRRGVSSFEELNCEEFEWQMLTHKTCVHKWLIKAIAMLIPDDWGVQVFCCDSERMREVFCPF